MASPVAVSTIPQKSSFFCQKKTDRFPIVVVALSDRDVVIISAEFSPASMLECHKKVHRTVKTQFSTSLELSKIKQQYFLSYFSHILLDQTL